MKPSDLRISIALLATLLLATRTWGEAPLPPVEEGPDPDSWHFSLALYGWVPGIDGTIERGDASANVDVGINDVLDAVHDGNLLAVSGHVEARLRALSIFADGLYIDFSKDQDTRFGGEANLDVQSQFYELGLAYEVYRTPLGESPNRHLAVDVLGGMRYASVDTNVNLFSARGVERTADGGGDLLDPFVGVRARVDLTDELFFLARGDVGGFGVDSDLIWNVNVGVGYQVSRNVDLIGGYRWLDYDWSNKGFDFDLQFGGPWAGLVLKF
jgi:opacity protein-like surface antigen